MNRYSVFMRMLNLSTEYRILPMILGMSVNFGDVSAYRDYPIYVGSPIKSRTAREWLLEKQDEIIASLNTGILFGDRRL